MSRMTIEEIIRYVMSFLGGGFAVAIGNWVHAAASARRQREVDYIREQLRSLYGPLFFFTQQNESLLNLSKQVDAAYTASFVGQDWSDDRQTQDTLKKEADTTIDLANEYVLRVVDNNERVMEILEKGWQFVDQDDIEELSRFQVDYTRFKTEVNGEVKLSFRIYKALGSISYMRPSMIDRVKRKAEAKEARIKQLSTPRWKCWW